ncbi:hypothetical protein [Microbacterium sp. NPDC091662]|uniref:hypothetical protein n=1 Tax=Microbacterium sp. NPDC091662 TaxID=3364211 RepID=UPI0038181806
MSELLVPADDEVALVDELKSRLGGQVGTAVPNPTPDEFVRVLSVGGVERDLVSDTFRLVVEGFALTEGRARQLCALAIAHAQAAGRARSLGGVPCYGVGVEGLPGNLPLPTLPTHYRYTATITADLRRVDG